MPLLAVEEHNLMLCDDNGTHRSEERVVYVSALHDERHCQRNKDA
jgi:hypothetical protein